MDSNNIIVSLIYYLGIASCAAQGAEKGKYDKTIPLLYYIANAFGGGFVRDIILNVHPWLLTLSALPDLLLVVISGLLYTFCFFIYKVNRKHYGIVMQLVTITDALGLGSFVCIGMDKAFIYSNNILTIIACGYVTAIGGGILASGKTLTKIFRSNDMVRYHLITLLGCCYYYIFRHSLYLICFIAIGLFLVNFNYSSLYNPNGYNLISPYSKVFFLYPAISNKNITFQNQKISKVIRKIEICPKCPKIYLMQHRIRQC